ncbi:putative Nodulin MtN21 /EamA-like transporter family protein [Tripterygium wilfordii]|uniref:WAT1-related protein n=1 Tax=Tripterygium wilfordii TaxID=458696 RepID=A0A7J7D932_TRIWF|nr:putative Nodulin MtN21 /EamA-like transporter family protein [Tripterygium wilfordii]
MGGLLGDYKYALAMFGLQFASAGLTLLSRAAFVRGTSPRVFIVYRQAIATLFVAPIAYFTRRKSSGSSIGLRSFALIFLLSLIGVTINQNIFFEGLFLSSSSMASAMTNLVPAITFVMASIAGLEKVNIRSSRSIAKIVGTVICVGGAVSMAMLKGPKLLNSELPQANSAFGSGGILIKNNLSPLVTNLGYLSNVNSKLLNSLIGALGVVIGLYVVLWGKAKEHVKIEEDADPNLPTVNILTDES